MAQINAAPSCPSLQTQIVFLKYTVRLSCLVGEKQQGQLGNSLLKSTPKGRNRSGTVEEAGLE
jgi:hypothetical protein